MLETFFTAVFAFVATNIDDLFILMMLLTQSSGRFKKQHIFAGQFLGMIALILISLTGVIVGLFIPLPYIGLLGVFPIYLGLREFFETDDEDAPEKIPAPLTHSSVFSAATLSVSAITIANGGDNIGVYVPLFISQDIDELILMILIFLLMTWLWLLIARYMAEHPLIADNLKKYNHILFPIMLIILGFYIIYECGTHTLLVK